MPYEAQNFDHLIGMEGFSETLLKNHFTLYQGYVTNTNKLLDTFAEFRKEETLDQPKAAELRRRFGWEFNGMRLHELYFSNMSKEKTELDASGRLAKKIAEDFGSTDVFMKEFKAVGAQRGIGWAVLSYDKTANRLINIWVNEHDVGHLATTTPVLIMDVFEHAFMIDYGLKRADYIDAFVAGINWHEAMTRFEKAV